MSISDFFTDTLGANLANTRWSWGAVNPVTNEVFLRVWADEMRSVAGQEQSLLFNPHWETGSLGLPERARHVRAIRDGAQGYGVVCVLRDPSSLKRTIKSFDDQRLLKFSHLVEDGESTYGVVERRVETSELARPPSGEATLIPDISQLLRSRVEETQREALVNARVGQGRFRAEVLAAWGGRCCVTGVSVLDAVRASHIKPWRDSTNEERLDAENGLPLVATLDALFDAGLITFDPDGRVVVSERLPAGQGRLLGLKGMTLRRDPGAGTQSYMDHHRRDVFR